MPPQSSSRWRVLTAAPRAPVEAPGKEQVANRYVMEEELASGGMGVVYRVRDRSTGQARALKRLKPEAAAEKPLVEAEREYQVLAGLNHPGIIASPRCETAADREPRVRPSTSPPLRTR